ncbi:EamA family transporter [Pseudomonas sp. NPDC089569]|uniref:EamA family transporter n=1 Tax=Pseudomonas sp. NPDC089569 TaxID=3390722 RepID=UPI003D02EE2A
MPDRQSCFPRAMSLLILALLACSFAGNHVAARMAFDDGAGLLVAILCRSGITALVLIVLVIMSPDSLRLTGATRHWQVLAGLCVTVQSYCIYSAVARIPVGVALLVVNLSPVFLAMITWMLGGPAPTRRALRLMGLIIFGLLVVLDVPRIVIESRSQGRDWYEGVALCLVAAVAFACALWITNNRLAGMPGKVRSLYTMLIVFLGAAAMGGVGAVPGGLAFPHTVVGWGALFLLVFLYGAAFSALFILMPKLDIARNAPAMNMEPVAALLLGWVVLGQEVGTSQILGATMVLGGILMLAKQKSGES